MEFIQILKLGTAKCCPRKSLLEWILGPVKAIVKAIVMTLRPCPWNSYPIPFRQLHNRHLANSFLSVKFRDKDAVKALGARGVPRRSSGLSLQAARSLTSALQALAAIIKTLCRENENTPNLFDTVPFPTASLR